MAARLAPHGFTRLPSEGPRCGSLVSLVSQEGLPGTLLEAPASARHGARASAFVPLGAKRPPLTLPDADRGTRCPPRSRGQHDAVPTSLHLPRQRQMHRGGR